MQSIICELSEFVISSYKGYVQKACIKLIQAQSTDLMYKHTLHFQVFFYIRILYSYISEKIYKYRVKFHFHIKYAVRARFPYEKRRSPTFIVWPHTIKITLRTKWKYVCMVYVYFFSFFLPLQFYRNHKLIRA